MRHFMKLLVTFIFVLSYVLSFGQEKIVEMVYIDQSDHYLLFMQEEQHIITDIDTNFLFYLDEEYRFMEIDERNGILQTSRAVVPHHGHPYLRYGAYRLDGLKLFDMVNYTQELIDSNLFLCNSGKYYLADTLGRQMPVPYGAILQNQALHNYFVCLNCFSVSRHGQSDSLVISDSLKLAAIKGMDMLVPIYRNEQKKVLEYCYPVMLRLGQLEDPLPRLYLSKKVVRYKKRLTKILEKRETISFEEFD
ncbi:MAG: hypothetical protein QNK23_06960 [Crocinitomicaceae bacterium]|nr:hypothetical protein [Crocinitomicaceae bacterium]